VIDKAPSSYGGARAAQLNRYASGTRMRPKWAFQLLPLAPDVLGKGFRVDPVTQELEDEVNAVFQRKFDFHGISKLVVRLGPKEGERGYYEAHGVAQKHYPSFDANAYLALSADEKRRAMRSIVLNVFAWLTATFSDAHCFEKARVDLGWVDSEIPPGLRSLADA
jgi:hypothetical protein